ncbi:MAG TPA: hypothetical protein VKA30_03015, partial [Actinomycetota bacterium]|nr:hypothetical protein [Actinomycetota bacterium]
MRPLLDVEVRRYLARRLVRIIAGLAVVGILTGCTVMFVRSHRLDATEVRALERQAEAEQAQMVQACVNGEFGFPESE